MLILHEAVSELQSISVRITVVYNVIVVIAIVIT